MGRQVEPAIANISREIPETVSNIITAEPNHQTAGTSYRFRVGVAIHLEKIVVR